MYTGSGRPDAILDCLRLLDEKLSVYNKDSNDFRLSFDTDNDVEEDLLSYLTGGTVTVDVIERQTVATKAVIM